MTTKIIKSYYSRVSKNLEFELTKYGRYVGYVSGMLFKPEYWLEKIDIEFLE